MLASDYLLVLSEKRKTVLTFFFPSPFCFSPYHGTNQDHYSLFHHIKQMAKGKRKKKKSIKDGDRQETNLPSNLKLPSCRMES